ncbi:MAG: hypothetical protein ACI9U2_005262 [Bradymonadia bacterium]
MLAQAGARPRSREQTDTRVVRDVRENTGGLIDSQDDVDGWGNLAAGRAAADGDRDGMPDDWERGHGSDAGRADNNGDANGDGYTNLENYLHWASRLDR